MKRLVPAIFVILGWASAASAATPATLTSLRAIRALSNAEAGQALPVAFEATVTFFRGSERTLFVQDGDQAIFVFATANTKLVPGDRVLVTGETHAEFNATVNSDHITLLRHGDLPKPRPATFSELIRTEDDCLLVRVRAVIRSVDLHTRADMRNANLPMHALARAQLLMEGGYVEAFIDTEDTAALSGLLDAEVEVTGAAGESFDGKLQPTGAQINVSSLDNIKVLKRREANPWSLAVTPMNQVLSGYHVRDLTARIRVHGSITYYNPGSAAVIQDGARSMWVGTQTRDPLHIGDEADAIGFPEVHNGLLALSHGEIKDSLREAPVKPLPVTWNQLTASGNLYDLVSIEGVVVTAVREASQDEYVLNTGGQLFTAIYRHEYTVPPMKQIPLGSRVRVIGICVLEDSNPFDGNVPFNILLRSFEDITVVAQPSPLNIRNLVLVVGLLLVVVAVVGGWGWTLERKVRRQTAAMSARTEAEAELQRRMAQLEQRRSRILEDINGSRPLAEIIEQITQMVSFRLGGAPSWCDIAGGARLGAYPAESKSLRIVREEIPARSGPPLGVLSTGLDPLKPKIGVETRSDRRKGMGRRLLDPLKPTAGDEAEALSLGVRLAALAIETRRLYSDLLHRSEFDLLTDIHNRFSLEKRLDAQIEEARNNASIFGLIYVDLDEFKQVNDLYGHRIGDLYLQEVARRMKQQLRSHDLLARLGGDEFAVLLPMVRNRAGVEEIALRLEACFDHPLALEKHTLQGSASFGIALYPEDSATRDGLLSAADAAMYVAKNNKRQIEMDLAQTLHAETTTQAEIKTGDRG